MSWTWVWIGGALALGFFLGATLMSLLVMSRDSESEDGQAPTGPESKNVLSWGRPVAAAGSGSFRETLSVEDPILTNDAWEEFNAKTGGIC
jgi:hypothetical protein